MLAIFLAFFLIVPTLFLKWTISFLRKKESKYSLPPGPPKLPIVGSLIPFLLADHKKPAVALKKLGKKYGPIFSLRLGSTDAVVLNDHAVLSEVATREELLSHLDEKDIWVLTKTNFAQIGLFNASPKMWWETRTFCQNVLRRHGFKDRTKLTNIVIDEFAEFCDDLKKQMEGGELRIKLSTQFNGFFLNNVWTHVTGKKHNPSEPKIQKHLTAVNDYMRAISCGANVVSVFPQLATLFPKFTGFADLIETCRKWSKIVKKAIADQRAEGTYKLCQENFLDEFLYNIDTADVKPEDKQTSIFTDENLESTLEDFAIGGTDTQSNLLKLLIRYMLTIPDLQRKLQDEVDQAVGNTRLVIESDLPKLPYLKATIYELFRLGASLPVAPRKLFEDWKFREYVIKKGSLIMLNIQAANEDPAVWDNPTKFDPTRFLSKHNTLINTEKIFSFGLGKRRCIGELLGKINMMFAAVILIQNFSFHLFGPRA